ncbi:MAG: type II toxin-antitoxin system death-on-curing family toxin [Candidatus Micrarchaeota archaeon]
MAIKHLGKAEVLSVYFEIIKKFGKEKGVVDEGNLESTLYRVEGYSAKTEDETIFWKATILLERIVLGHPFVDGNKRTAFQVTKTFLKLNGHELESPEEETISFLVLIAKGLKNRYSIKSWLENHSMKAL